MKKFVFAFATVGLALASAAHRHNVTIYEPVAISGQVLKPGQYQLEIVDNRAVIRGGKQTVEAPIQIENGDKKYSSNVVSYSGAVPNAKLEAIRIGGTTTKVVFTKPQAAGN